MDGIPANQRLAERLLIQFVNYGEWEIDYDGPKNLDNGGKIDVVQYK